MRLNGLKLLQIFEATLAKLKLFGYFFPFFVALDTKALDHSIFFEGVKIRHTLIEAIQAQTIFLVDFSLLTALNACSLDVLNFSVLIKLFLFFLVLVLISRVGVILQHIVVVIIKQKVDIFVVKIWSNVLLVVMIVNYFLFADFIDRDIGFKIFGHEVHDDSLGLLAVSGYLLLFSAFEEILELLFFNFKDFSDSKTWLKSLKVILEFLIEFSFYSSCFSFS